jgi:hypothetical protein
MKTKLHFQRFFAALLLFSVSAISWAYDFVVDNIYYDKNSDGKSVTVTYKDDYYHSGKVTIPSSVPYSGKTYSVTSIGEYAFSNCSGLSSIEIPNSVTSIGWGAFEYCSGLTSITIPESVTSIGAQAFEGSGLTRAEFANIESLCKISFDDFTGNPLYYAEHLYIDGQEVKDVVIPENVTSIGKYTFFGCSGLKSVTIGNSVTGIANYAFECCSGLKSVTIGNSVTNIGREAFCECTGLTSVTIGSGVSSIGHYAFWKCSSLESVTCLTKSVPTTGSYIFEDVPQKSATLYVPTSALNAYKTASQWKEFGKILDIATVINFADANVKAICVTNWDKNGNGELEKDEAAAVTSLGEVFKNNTAITSFDELLYFTGLTKISENAFYGCSKLNSVTIPNGVTIICERAFVDCYGLTSITIPEGVTSIGSNAFYNCSGLKSVTCLAESIPTMGTNVFYNVPQSSATLYVPTSSVNAYKTAEQWKDFGTICSRVYIEIDVTAQFPIDWQGWNGATGYVGGAAPKVTTNDGRTTPACEKFNGSSAEQGTVFKRTITGLVNGTYRIELFGAAASTKGRDTNIDSNMTASDEGDETAVYLYAKTASGTVKQYIPVHWATNFSEIATAVLNEVIVTDGTVETGMVSDKKFTNWHVVQIKGVTALVDAIELHEKALSEAQEAINDAAYVNVIGSERTALSQAITSYSVVSEQTAEAYQAAVNVLETATKALTDAKESYDAWADIKNHSFPYALEEKKAAAEAAAAVSPANAADAVSKTETMLPLYRRYAESSALMEGIEGATDMTSYINNPKAKQAIDASVWQTVLGKSSGGSISIRDDQPWTDGSGDTNHKYFDGGNWGASAWDVTFQQDITLPAGKYQLTAVGRSERDVALTLFAGDETAEMAHISSIGGLFNNGWEQTSVEFELKNDATVGIGVRGVTPAYHNWMSFSDFRLVQFKNYILSGKCGENLDYVLTSDYVLTIYGTGTMYDGTNIDSKPWYKYRESISAIVIDNGVTSIGKYAFYNCSGLTSVTIPESVTSIGESAFERCTGLKSVTIGNSVTSIGREAFSYCSGLTKAQFASIESLCNISFGDNSANPLSYAKHLYIGGQEVKDVVIPESVTSINRYAFSSCSGLKSVTIPNSVTSIGENAFSYCSCLKSVTIPNSVTSIGYCAFYSCSGLTSITIPESVTSIGGYAFSYCSGLTSVSIPESVTSISRYAFSYCSGLKSVTCLAESIPTMGTNVFYNVPQSSATLYVPTSSVNAYKTAEQWKDFGTIKAYSPDATSIALNKTEATLEVGAQEQLTATVLPKEAEQAIIWVSSNSSVATVDKNGLVTAVAVGTATITATTTDGTNLEASCTVTVIPQRIYIETDVTAQFPIDWQGWNGATGYVGWAAPQVTTNDGRTTPACEKFNGSSAEQGTVFTRTLTGLVNGTYRIELYGAAASTKGRDTNIDSDMTASDEGNETAVYLYAKTASGTVKQYIPVHWATSFSEIATAVLNEVIVTDGTVEIGMVSDKKFTNWHVVQIKGVTALVDAIALHEKTLTRAQEALNDAAYINVVGSERTALSQAIATYSIVAEQTTEAYQEAINALNAATNTYTIAKESYDAWANFKNISFPYASDAKKNAAEAAAAVLPTNAANAVSRTETMLPLYRQYAESSALMEGVEGATNMTSYIKNPKAEQAIDASVWQTVLGEGSGGNISIWTNEPWTDGNGSTNHKYFDGGNWDDTSWDVAFKQNITLPAGRYQLTAIGRSSGDVTLTLFAGEETAEMAHIGNTGGLFNRGWEQTSVEFELTTGATVGIGVRGVTPAYHNWMSFSDFRLVQFPGGDTGVDSMQTNDKDAEDDDSIYDLNGRKLSKKPENGYYIQGGKLYRVK